MNKKLLLKVADAIESNPEHFDMNAYVAHPERSNYNVFSVCGTVACIAGWAVYLGKETDKSFDQFCLSADYEAIEQQAQRLLRITQLQSYTLFFRSEWLRADLRNRYRNGTPKSRASIAASYVRWFVENGGSAEQT